MMVNKIVTVISLLDFWDVSRGEVETYSIGQDRLGANQGLAGLNFSETLSHERIQDGVFGPLREINLGFKERRM
jgi:hypothetical protein